MPARLKFQSFKAKSMSCPLNLLMLNSTHNGENLRPFPKCCLPVMAWLTLSQSPFPISPLGLKPLFQFWPCDGLTRASMLSLLSERTTKIHRSPFSNSLSSYSDKDWRRLNWLKKILWRCFWIAVLTNIWACTRPATEDSQLCWCIRYFAVTNWWRFMCLCARQMIQEWRANGRGVTMESQVCPFNHTKAKERVPVILACLFLRGMSQ